MKITKLAFFISLSIATSSFANGFVTCPQPAYVENLIKNSKSPVSFMGEGSLDYREAISPSNRQKSSNFFLSAVYFYHNNSTGKTELFCNYGISSPIGFATLKSVNNTRKKVETDGSWKIENSLNGYKSYSCGDYGLNGKDYTNQCRFSFYE